MTRLLLCTLCCMLLAGAAFADVSFLTKGAGHFAYQADTLSLAGQSGTLSMSPVTVKVVPVPEPSSIGLLALQLLVVGALLRYKFFAV